MENSAQNNLEPMVQQWRAQLAQSPAFKQENVDELEEHLRDSIATLKGKGLSEVEAFLIASRRIGGGEKLETEFERINSRDVWLQRLWWMLVGIQAWGFVSTFSNNFVQYGVLAGVYSFGREYGFNLEATALITSAVSSVGAYVALSWLFWRIVTRKSDRMMGYAERFGFRSRYLAACLFATLLWVKAWVGAVPMQMVAFKTVPLIQMYQRFSYAALLRQVTYWLQPLMLLALTFIVGIRKSRNVST